MRFSGYWVRSVENRLEVLAGSFNDTELSESSDWKEALQNDGPGLPRGFVDPLTMIHEVSRQIAGEISEEDLEAARSDFWQQENGLQVSTLADFARLIQVLVPRRHLPGPASSVTMADDSQAGAEIPFA